MCCHKKTTSWTGGERVWFVLSMVRCGPLGDKTGSTTTRDKTRVNNHQRQDKGQQLPESLTRQGSTTTRDKTRVNNHQRQDNGQQPPETRQGLTTTRDKTWDTWFIAVLISVKSNYITLNVVITKLKMAQARCCSPQGWPSVATRPRFGTI